MQQVEIDQITYLKQILTCFDMQNATIAPTPFSTGYNPETNTDIIDPECQQKFQQVIRSLLYLMLGTRLDIAFAVIKMSQFLANPSQEHLDKAKYIFCYLVGMQNYCVVFDGKKGESLQAFTNLDWASDLVKHWSTMGFFMTLASGIISWQSRLQKTVTLSSTEAEYMAMSDTC